MPDTILKDFRYLSYAEWISGDYLEFVKKSILPNLNKTYPIKIRELRVLLCLADSSELVTATDIATHLRQDPATITRSLVVLIGKGYVNSRENYHDGRSRLLELSEKGEQTANHFFDLFKTAVETHVENNLPTPHMINENAISMALDHLALRARELYTAHKLLAKLLGKTTKTPA